jgi:hypothetical protein
MLARSKPEVVVVAAVAVVDSVLVLGDYRIQRMVDDHSLQFDLVVRCIDSVANEGFHIGHTAHQVVVDVGLVVVFVQQTDLMVFVDSRVE